MLNIHPALLPAFGGKGMYGRRVHAAVLASGAWFSGPTVHFVDEQYDRGVILAQRVVPVLRDDSADDLAHRVLEQEWRVYPAAVGALCAGRVTWRADGVPIIDAAIVS
jgi:phosphoribosylglycinamide formyltransferase